MDIRKYLDSTYLKTPSQAMISEDETVLKIHALVDEAIEYQFKLVMIRAEHILLAREKIKASNSFVLVGTVIGFHEGTYSKEEKLTEAQKAIDFGVDELDFVANYSAFTKGEIKLVAEEIVQCTDLGLKNNKVVKWIIEVAALTDTEIASISKLIKELVIENFGIKKAETVFVKSSTGFYQTKNGLPNGATIDAVKIMVENSKPLQIKAAGGVKTKEEAIEMIRLGVTRIGTSSAKEIVNEISINSEY